MKILVCVKKVPDFKARIALKPDNSSVDTAHAKMVMNPFDEIAVEEAIRLKEKGHASEVIVVSIDNTTQEILRTALAMGADRAILLQADQEVVPLVAAKAMSVIIEKEKPQLVILGKQAVDTDNNQVGQMLAGLLNWPQGTFASRLEIKDEGIQVTREIDGGLETLLLQLPAVITTDLRLNEPRYISLPNIVQAKRKLIEVFSLTELKINTSSNQKILKIVVPQKKRTNIRVENVAELVKRLKDEAKVIS